MTLSVFDAARETPQGLALISSGRACAWAELADRTHAALSWLRSRGLSNGDPRPVALVATTAPATLEILLALFEAEIAVLPIHPRLTAVERGALLERCPVQLSVDAETHWIETSPHASRPRELTRLALAIVPTSGTSGAPKLVVLSRRAFEQAACSSHANLPLTAADRWLLSLPLAHVGGLSIVTRCLLARACVVLPERGSPRLSSDVFLRDRVTLVSLVPTQLQRLLDAEPAFSPNPELRAVLLGGAAPHPALIHRAEGRNLPLLPSYGLTEACSQVTTRSAADLATKRPIGRFGEITSSGRPLSGIEVRIADGIIQVRGANLCDGYLEEPAQLTPDGFWVTGDRGRIDAHGELFVFGRASDLIISGGENVDPLEVEAALCALPGVAQACVFGVEDEVWGQRVAAVMVSSESHTPRDDTLFEALSARLASFKQPRLIAFVSELPTTPAGKLDRLEAKRAFTAGLRERARA